MALEKKRWLVLISSGIINLCIGSLYAWSVFAAPFAQYFNERNNLSGAKALVPANLVIVFVVANAIVPFTILLGGYLNRKYGVRTGIWLGIFFFCSGIILSGFAENIVLLILSYGIFCGIGVGIAYTCTVNNSLRLFPDKRTWISTFLTASYGLSSVIIPPIAFSLIQKHNILVTFRVLGIVFFAIMVICSFFIVQAPKDFMPSKMVISKITLDVSQTNSKNYRQMLASPSFYIMFLILMCGTFSGLMVISQVSAISQNMIRLNLKDAAMAVSWIALFNSLGRVFAIYFADRFRKIEVIRVMFLVSVFGLILLAMSSESDKTLLRIATAAIGISFGGFVGVYPGFTSERFGTRYHTTNYGIILIGFALAGVFGPLIAAKVLLSTGSYQISFVIGGILALLGFGITYLYTKLLRIEAKNTQKSI